MLEITGLNLKYGEHEIFLNSDFKAGCGITCIIGHSGSGKSSLLNTLTYQISFNCIGYTINGQSVGDLSKEEAKSFVRQHMAYFYQEENFISDLSCYDNIRFYAELVGNQCGEEDIKKYLEMVNLDIDDKKFPDNLSGGEKQRLALAKALAKDTEVILCDEMTASLDNELKIEILDLLKTIAQKYHKIIIITSHDEDIYEQCDCLYEIENKQLVLKHNCSKEDVRTLNHSQMKMLTKKTLKQYSYSKNERQFWMYLLYSIISAVVVSISAFLIFFGYRYIKDQNRILDKLSQTELYVINQSSPSDGMRSYSYYPNNEPFDKKIENEIKSIENIEAVYPFYICDLFGSMIDPASRPDTTKIILTSNQKENIEKTISISSGYPGIIPFYPEQEFDEKMIHLNPENPENGIYVNKMMVSLLEIPIEELVNYRMKMTIYLPVLSEMGTGTSYAINSEGTTSDGVEFISAEPDYRALEIEVPILGQIDPWYNEEIGSPNMYFPFEYLEELRNSVNDHVTLKENQVIWSPNAYIVFANSPKNLEDINIQIKNLDSQISTGNRHMNMSAWYQSRSYVNRSTIISLIIVVGAGLILSYGYGIFYSQKNMTDIRYFKRNGLTKKEYQHLLIEDCKLQSIAIILFSILISIILSFIAIRYGFITKSAIFSSEILIPVLCILLGTIMQTIISRLDFYRKSLK